MAQINLSPGTQHLASVRRRQRVIYLLSVLVIVLLGLFWLGLYLVEAQLSGRVERAQEELAALETEVARNGDLVDRISLFEERLAVMDQLLDDQTRWSSLFTELERLLPPEVVLTSLDFNDSSNQVELRGTVPSIDNLAQALASFEGSPGSPTDFNGGGFSVVKRNELQNEEGEVISSGYEFGAFLNYRP